MYGVLLAEGLPNSIPALLPVADNTVPAMLDISVPPVLRLPPVMSAVVVIALRTLPLKLSPAAFRLAPVILPVADIVTALVFINAPNVFAVTL